ncbi:alpha/beta hydrolase [Bacillus sp. 31A1R]|uniref:Alpha/beta hydrolase n=1 Tax=Robertmurraya mangrovi TaxID=3098077 RepID=A0ABU5ISY4_9BACI|nr:alpha/beta hydrolase [Bacillus sp. 31A1R]MDZ5470253.1 alpha/beta hydrolase [Bacillus sp. 31A1R]
MTLKEKVQLKKVEIPNGETIAYREREGGTKNLLLIHGNMTSSKHWDVLIEKIDPEFKVFAMDMRGFGESSYNQAIYSIKELSDDIKLFVDEIELYGFSIVGWSLGAPVCMQFVADYPDYCNRLILLAPGSTRGFAMYAPSSEQRLETFDQVKIDPTKVVPTETAYRKKDRAFLKFVYDAVIYTKNQPDPNRYEEYLDDMLTQRNYAETVHALNQFNISHEHNGLVQGNGLASSINIPTLVLRGDHDLVITEQMTKEILDDIGENARFVELKDCGHSPLIDDLDQLLEVMTEFLD